MKVYEIISDQMEKSDLKGITKAVLCEHLATSMAFDKSLATRFVEEFFIQVRASLMRGEQVKIAGLGNFNPVYKKSRLARNPKTKEPVLIPPRQTVTFKAGQKLKERVKHGRLLDED